MNDLELLELAAKAAGYEKDPQWKVRFLQSAGGSVKAGNSWKKWNPLTDDGDAFRLAVKLNINVFIYDDETSTGTLGVVAKGWASKEENTRRAIVRAAAEIGKALA